MTEKKHISLPEEISVRSLAALLGVNPTVLIGKLIAGGVMATINQNLDFDTACLIAGELGFEADSEEKDTSVNKTSDSKEAVGRAPIVTIMGHVDHGKTSLLDFIRKSNVTAGESGGITQHISAYQIDYKMSDNKSRKITFIDTPGHEAFSALRSHGATMTDVIILVVAADDGVKPQTVEVIEHAKKSNVPIVVAINKSDLPTGNADRVKQQLMEHGLSPEEWGGSTVMLPVSAKTGLGVDKLLEMVILTTDLLELKAEVDALPEGIVIEAKLDKQIGPLATVLVYNGTLRSGQVVVVGKTYGRVRAMEDDLGEKISQAGPAKPVRIIGLKDVPQFGDRIEVVPNEKVARSMTQSHGSSAVKGGEGENTLNVVLKADVGGSLAALEESLAKIAFKDAKIQIVSSGIGPVNENDLNLAKASNAWVMAFRVPIIKRIKDIAEKDGLKINEYWIIYELIEILEKELKAIATPTFTKVQLGRQKVLAIFSWKKDTGIVGGEVLDGVIKPKVEVEIFREKELIGTAKAGEMKVGKVAVDQAEKGTQCGITLSDATAEPQVGDVINYFETKEDK